MSNDAQVRGYLDQYDDLADAVIGDPRPNVQAEMQISNAEMVEEILETMGWEDFDLLTAFDFSGIYDSGSLSQILAYFYLAHLRVDLFNSAIAQEIGDFPFNKVAQAGSEYWYLKLRDKYDALCQDVQIVHMWLN